LQDLALCASPQIDQKPIFIVFDDQSGEDHAWLMARMQSAKKEDFKNNLMPSVDYHQDSKTRRYSLYCSFRDFVA